MRYLNLQGDDHAEQRNTDQSEQQPDAGGLPVVADLTHGQVAQEQEVQGGTDEGLSIYWGRLSDRKRDSEELGFFAQDGRWLRKLLH
ncbi:hypothetical protein DNK01_06875 [Stutzerimonas kirkiae]|nr:hypothetical protein DNK01_06875 [Stutzerimonas kirkiae]